MKLSFPTFPVLACISLSPSAFAQGQATPPPPPASQLPSSSQAQASQSTPAENTAQASQSKNFDLLVIYRPKDNAVSYGGGFVGDFASLVVGPSPRIHFTDPDKKVAYNLPIQGYVADQATGDGTRAVKFFYVKEQTRFDVSATMAPDGQLYAILVTKFVPAQPAGGNKEAVMAHFEATAAPQIAKVSGLSGITLRNVGGFQVQFAKVQYQLFLSGVLGFTASNSGSANSSTPSAGFGLALKHSFFNGSLAVLTGGYMQFSSTGQVVPAYLFGVQFRF